MLASATYPRPPSLPPRGLRDAWRSVAILGAAGALVTLVTLALSAMLVSRSGLPVTTGPTPQVELELAAEPTEIGGHLVVTGDRPGEITVASASSEPGYEPDPDTAGGLAYVRGEVLLSGPGGDIVLSPRSGDVTRVEYDGLSFYLDPGDCTTTPGGRNAELGLIHLRLECGAITDLRNGNVIALEGVISVPADSLGDRGGLPSTGGTVQVGGAPIELVLGVGLVGGFAPIEGSGTVPLLVPADALNSLGIHYNPEDESYRLTALQRDGELVELTEPCLLPAEPLGRLNPQTTVVRLTIDCADVALPNGATETISGSLVVDLVMLDEGG